jgi:hypothetical protein
VRLQLVRDTLAFEEGLVQDEGRRLGLVLPQLFLLTPAYPALEELGQLLVVHLAVLRVVFEEREQLFYVDCGLEHLERDVGDVSSPEDLADFLVGREAAVLDVVFEAADAAELDGLADAVFAVGEHLVDLADLVAGQQADLEAW